MKHVQLLNNLISRYHYKSYLEIGCENDVCFNQIKIEKKFGCDPASGGTHRMTSDEFFEKNNMTFDLIFVDGLHWSEQVIRDISNGLKFLNKNGMIVLHDCNPPNERIGNYPIKSTPWTGDCWKAIVHCRQMPYLDCVVGNFDWGCGIIREKKNTDLLVMDKWYSKLTYEEMNKNRIKWLRLKSYSEVIQWLDQGDKEK